MGRGGRGGILIFQSVLRVEASECELSRHTALRSDLHVHWPDLSSLILPHPQLSVFGWVHTLQELVHRLHRLDKERAAVSGGLTHTRHMPDVYEDFVSFNTELKLHLHFG